MNCERFQTIAADLARDEMVEASERANALMHVDECKGCAQTWNNQRDLSAGLRTVADRMRSLQAPAHLEGQLRAAFRDRSRVRPITSTPQRWRYWASAVAAALLIVFGVMAWRVHIASLPLPPIVAKSEVVPASQTESPKPGPTSVVGAVGNQSAHESAPPRHVASNRNPRKSQPRRAEVKHPGPQDSLVVAANTDAKEVATDFVSLGYGSALDLQDGGQLVRIELPRSALARFGLPMNMDRADERVKADVLVGADGLARAIRFVK